MEEPSDLFDESFFLSLESSLDFLSEEDLSLLASLDFDESLESFFESSLLDLSSDLDVLESESFDLESDLESEESLLSFFEASLLSFESLDFLSESSLLLVDGEGGVGRIMGTD